MTAGVGVLLGDTEKVTLGVLLETSCASGAGMDGSLTVTSVTDAGACDGISTTGVSLGDTV